MMHGSTNIIPWFPCRRTNIP